MAHLDFEKAKAYALRRLETELPGYLQYHTIAHTRDDVAPAASVFADEMGVTGEDKVLLMTAAYFHDLGFVYQYHNHEEVSIQIAREVLPMFGYLQRQIDVIAGIIAATRMPQSPYTLLEKIMADADMNSLGREDFFEIGDNLRGEMEALGYIRSDNEWYEFEIQFLTGHNYFTSAAHQLRAVQKEHNIQKLYAMLAVA